MRFFESNYRHKNYSAGFHYIAEFKWRNSADSKLWSEMVRALVEVYGPMSEVVPPTDGGLSFRKYNENWRQENNAYAKRRRIYFKTEADMSLIMLRIS